MRLVRSIDDYQADADLLLSIGVFDGVHAGHRAVLASLVGRRKPSTRVAAMTFEHHPQAFLRPRSAPRVLTVAEEKINLLAECGLDVLFLLRFDQRIANLQAEAFLRDVLVGRLNTRMLVVGDNWKFGKDRGGDAALAERFFRSIGREFVAARLMERGGEKISSSRIRALIAERRFSEADALLERPYTVRGLVVAGDGRGHLLGYPTANLNVPAEKLVPSDGVYAAIAHHDGRDYKSVISIGNKPTFNGTERAVEAFIANFSGSIYGDQVALRAWRFLRDQERFDSADALTRQIAKDIQLALR